MAKNQTRVVPPEHALRSGGIRAKVVIRRSRRLTPSAAHVYQRPDRATVVDRRSVRQARRLVRVLFMDFFSDRTVAIVGNAGSLLETNRGPEIEAHDLVLRMNRGLPMVPAAQGTRTDVLVFAQYRSVAQFVPKFNARHLIWMSSVDRKEIDEDSVLPGGLLFYDVERRAALIKRLGARPSVGAMVLDLVSSAGARSATIFGFDFKRSNTYYREKNYIGPHDFDVEERYCHEIVAEYGWTIARDY